MTNKAPEKNGNITRINMRQKRRKESYVFSVVAIILTSVLIASIALNIFLISNRKDTAVKSTADSASNSETASMSTESSGTNATSETEQLTVPIETIEKYEEMIADYESELESLREMVDSYAEAAQNNFDAQSAAFTSLAELLAIENRPIHKHAKDNEDDPDVLTPAEVSFTYLDLETGLNFGFNDDKITYTASIVKAPFMYAVFHEIEEFEYNKLNFTSDGKPLYDEDGKALFDGKHPNLDEDGNIIYLEGEEKYDLSREWVYDSKKMFVKGSGEIQKKKDGFTLTYLELAEYALKYSDNIAFDQFTKTFGREHYNNIADSIGVTGHKRGFMQLSASDSAKFLKVIYDYFETDSIYASTMKKALTNTIHSIIIPPAVKDFECVHKYGWDIDAYHDIAIVYHERPFAVVVLTDLDEGRYSDNAYIQKIVRNLLSIHESFTPTENTEI